ncbi:DinB family protein [Arundinibacter roseus]|uniref:DinB family protein n=1 Tax=Arundinibacter roseus TaxID=2070510 RepID=A0A4R4KJJ8_9BACT|nr:DinB family protein [Arundinibacter roseus]TDB67076.1 DinB family protein [Arundinibacter roseus]
METKEEILRIIDLLNDTYESEQAWHGPSLVEVLRDVTPKKADKRIVPNTHTIAELVFHITTWRIFAVRKLQGDAAFDVNTKEKNWKKFTFFDDFEWETLQMELSLSQEELISELEKKTSDAFLEDIVPGRDYTFYTLLHGLVNHDMYHAGQISLIKKGLTLKAFEEEDLEDYKDSSTFGENYNDFD